MLKPMLFFGLACLGVFLVCAAASMPFDYDDVHMTAEAITAQEHVIGAALVVIFLGILGMLLSTREEAQ